MADTLQHMLGMNFNWWGFAGSDSAVKFTLQSQPIDDTSYHVADPFYYDTTHAPVLVAPYSILLSAAYGVDVRVYLPGTSDKTSEYTYGWKNKAGSLISPSDPEWFVDTAGIPSGQYILSDLSGVLGVNADATIDPYTPGGWGQPVLNPTHVGSYSYELVYYFAPTDTSSVGDNDALYSVEYWIRKASDTGYVLIVADTITKAKYRTLSIASTQAAGHFITAEYLAKWTGQQSHNYKIQKRILNVRSYYEDGRDVGDFGRPPSVDVRVRTFHKLPIYVRLLRIRDWVGQRLLTRAAESQLYFPIYHLLHYLNNDSIASWTVGNEIDVKAFHAWSYLNDQCVRLHAPRANVLAPISYELLQRVMHDQMEYSNGTNIYPANLWHEWTPFTGEGWRTAWDTTSSGYPKRYWAYQSSQSYPSTPMPFPFAPAGDTVKPFLKGISIMNDYTSYTYHWQNDIIGYNSDMFGGGRGDAQTQFNRSQACYLYDVQHPQPYLLMAQANPFRWTIRRWATDDALHSGDSVLYGLVYDSVRAYWKTQGKSDWDAHVLAAAKADTNVDSLYNRRVVVPYLNRHAGTNVYCEDSMFDPIWINRATTAAEADYQFWSGVQHGMKGYVVNIAYDDRQIQNGIIFDTTGFGGRDSLVRSQDRTCITIQQCDIKLAGSDSIYIRHSADSTGAWYCNTYRYTELPPGFKEMYPTFRSIINEELAPIVHTLAGLSWKGALSWHMRDSTPTNLAILPIRNVRSATLTGSVDSDAETYVDIGISKLPSDSTATYITLLNRRLWCDPLDTLTTDYRTISFIVDSTKFGKAFASVSDWRVTDVSGQVHDTTISAHDTFSFTVKPGQGKLFRIAPAIGLQLGQMATNTYNNARHIAAVETDTSTTRFLTTYQRSGKIVVSYPVETPSGISKRSVASPVDTIIDGSGLCSTPAIAYNKPNNKIGLVYAVTHYDTHSGHNDTIVIYHTQTTNTLPYAFIPAVRLDSFTVHNSGSDIPFEAAPAIVPANNSTNTFWISWRHPSLGGQLTLVNTSGSKLASTTFAATSSGEPKFISLATHTPLDTVHLAWEEYTGWGSADIFYMNAVYGSGSITKSAIKNISNFIANTGCDNDHFPQITVDKHGRAGVIWEESEPQFIRGGVTIQKQSAVERERDPLNGWLGSAIKFVVVRDTLPAGIGYSAHLFPNVAMMSDSVYFDDNGAWGSIWRRFMWHDSISGVFGFAQWGRNDSTGGTPLQHGWETFKMIEPSLEPAMAMYHRRNDIPRPVLYREITDKAGSVAKISQYDFPLAPVSQTKLPQFRISLIPNLYCKGVVGGSMSSIVIKHDSSQTAVGMSDLALSSNTVDVSSPIGWDDNRYNSELFALSAGDTLSYDRYFQVGTYTAGDTSAIAASLADSNDFAKVRILLRSNGTNALVAVLDSVNLSKRYGVTQSIAVGGSTHGSYYVSSAPVGLVYMSIEASRGNVADSFSVNNCVVMDGDYLDMIAPDAPSYKTISQPTSTVVERKDPLVTIVPNPFTSSTTVSVTVEKDAPLNVTLFDALGRKVMELTNALATTDKYTYQLSADQLTSGSYYVRVQSGMGVATRKIELIK
ncbi:MAG: T9SS type A sorting domain-containing protein [Bacteroidetes bacterium]|nr:T9SS type A sorting domain-containing protein [Bacteroidota bacterium]